MRCPMLVLLTVGILAAACSMQPQLLHGGQSENLGQAAGRRDGGSTVRPADRDVDVRLAKAKLDLAKAELAVATNADKRTPGAVSAGEIERLKSEVKHAEAKLDDAQAGVNSKLDLQFAKAAAAIADAELQVSLQANEKAPGAVTEIDIRRLRLTSLAAHLQVEKLETADARESRIADLQAELNDLRKEVAALRKSVEELLQKTQTSPQNK